MSVSVKDRESPLRLLLAIGVRLYRDGLAQLLSAIPEISVYTAEDGNAAAECASIVKPDIALLDARLTDAAAVLGRIVNGSPGTRVIVLGIDEADEEIIGWAEAGVAGYVPVNASFDTLVATVRSVAKGELLCSPKIAALLLRHVARGGPQGTAGHASLTRRELDILTLIDQGSSNKQIALCLHIELSTVKNHVHHILEKLDASGRLQAAARMRPLIARSAERGVRGGA